MGEIITGPEYAILLLGLVGSIVVGIVAAIRSRRRRDDDVE